MTPYMTEKLASQQAEEVRTRCAQSVRARRARQAMEHPGHPRVIRRRAGWALIALGLRLAYAAGED